MMTTSQVDLRSSKKFRRIVYGRLIPEAFRSEGGCKHAAAAIKGSKVIAISFNSLGIITKPRKHGPDIILFNHAEVVLMNRMIYGKVKGKIDIVIIRVNRKTSKLDNSKPCKHCIDFIKYINNIKKNISIRYIYYSTKDPNILNRESLKNIKVSHCSSMFRSSIDIDKTETKIGVISVYTLPKVGLR